MRGNGYIYLRGQTYWVSFYLNGVEQRESTKETDPGKAEKYLKARLDAAGAARRGSETFTTGAMNRLTVSDLLDALKADFQQRDKATAGNLSVIKRAKEYFGDRRATAFGPKDVTPFYKRRCQDKCLPATARHEVFAVQPL